MYNTQAKHRVAPEKPASHRPGFALHLIENNAGEVLMIKSEFCKIEGCDNKKKGSYSICSMHKYRWDTYKSYEAPPSAAKQHYLKKISQYSPGIVKICKKHGELTIEGAYKRVSPKTYLGYSFVCKICSIDSQWKRGCKIHGNLLDKERTVDGRCKKCHTIWGKSKRETDPSYFRERRQADQKANPEKYAMRYKRNYARERSKLNEDQIKGQVTKSIIRLYKIDSAQYLEMFSSQNGRCKICGNHETCLTKSGHIKRLSVDHSHESGVIRGLLCHKCNILLGNATDSIEILELAIMYLEDAKGKEEISDP